MAEEEKNKEQENQKQENDKKEHMGVVGILIIALVLIVCITGGFFTGGLLSSDTADASNQNPNTPPKEPAQEKADSKQQKKDKGNGESWYYDLDPVLANLNVPGATRYVRAVLTLEMSGELSQGEGKKLLQKKKPVLINWLTIYLSSLGLDEVKGDENLRRIQNTVQDVFNEKLWPDSKPKIEKVLIKEFPIQ